MASPSAELQEKQLGRPYPGLEAREEHFALNIGMSYVHRAGSEADDCEMTNQPNLSHQGGIQSVWIMQALALAIFPSATSSVIRGLKEQRKGVERDLYFADFQRVEMTGGFISKAQTSRPPVALSQGRRGHPFSPFGLWQKIPAYLSPPGMQNTKTLKTGVGRGQAGLKSHPQLQHLGRCSQCSGPGFHIPQNTRARKAFSPTFSQPVLLTYKPIGRHCKHDT